MREFIFYTWCEKNWFNEGRGHSPSFLCAAQVMSGDLVQCRCWLSRSGWGPQILHFWQAVRCLWCFYTRERFWNTPNSTPHMFPKHLLRSRPTWQKNKDVPALKELTDEKGRERVFLDWKQGPGMPLCRVVAREGPRKGDFLVGLPHCWPWPLVFVTRQELKHRFWNQTDLGEPPCSATVWLKQLF